MDLEDVFRLKFKKNEVGCEYTFSITLHKHDSAVSFYTSDINVYENLIMILKKFCILEDFSKKYDLLDFIGSGYFASVYLAKNRETNQKFAAKIIKKNDEAFKANQVKYFNIFKIINYL